MAGLTADEVVEESGGAPHGGGLAGSDEDYAGKDAGGAWQTG